MASSPQTQPELIVRTAAGFGFLCRYILLPQPYYLLLDLRLLDISVTFMLSEVPFRWFKSQSKLLVKKNIQGGVDLDGGNFFS